MLDAALHYTVYPDDLITYSMVFMECVRFFAMFLVCYFYAKKSTIFIPSHKRWIYFLRGFMALNFAWQLAVFITSEFMFKFAYKNNELLCMTSLFFALRVSAEIASVIFLVIGIIISKNVWIIVK